MRIKTKAFTLAEVLITLGIIGVVAAITLPTLIQNYKKQVYVNQLKKSVSTLEQGFKKILADEGVEDLGQVKDFISDTTGTYDGTSFLLKKYFKGFAAEKSSIYPEGHYDLDGKHYNNRPTYNDAFYLSDGTLVGVWGYFGDYTSSNPSFFGDVYIDVNGDKKLPNKMGRDIFYFAILKNGNLIPEYGKAHSDIEGSKYYWRNNTRACGTPDSSTIPANTSGWGCAARIIENGWKMDY